MKTYILFETDQWQMINSRVLMGVFSSEFDAIEAAKNNNIDYFSIVEAELDEFMG